MIFKEWNRTALIGLGLMAGLVQVVSGVVMFLAGVYFARWSMLVSLVVLLLCIVVGTRWYTAKYLNGEITYAQAVVVGIVISVSTGLVYAVYNIVSISFFYPDFLDEVARAQLALGAAQQQSFETFESMRVGLTASGIAIPNLIRLSIVGSLLSFLTSLFLKRRK